MVAGVQCASQPRFVRASFVRERKEGAPLSSRTSCQTFILDIQQLLRVHLESFLQKLKTILISLHTISIQSLEKVFCLFPPQPRFSSRLENNCTTHWRNDGNIILNSSWFFEKESHESLKVGHLDSVGLSTNYLISFKPLLYLRILKTASNKQSHILNIRSSSFWDNFEFPMKPAFDIITDSALCTTEQFTSVDPTVSRAKKTMRSAKQRQWQRSLFLPMSLFHTCLLLTLIRSEFFAVGE